MIKLDKTDGIGVRLAKPADAIAIRGLTRSAYAKWVPLIGREPKPMTADYDALIDQHRFDLAVEQDEMVGLIETVIEPDGLLIENVAVSPAHQRRGIGRMLLAYAEQIAQEARKRSLRLYTIQRFIENIRLYTGLGYTIDREEDLGVAVVVHMRKSLQTNVS